MFEWLKAPEKKGFAFTLPTMPGSHKPEVFLFSPMKEIAEGIMMGMLIGGLLGVLHGTVNDCRGKDLCKLSSGWAINGATIGAIASGLSCIIFGILLRIEKTPTFYVK